MDDLKLKELIGRLEAAKARSADKYREISETYNRIDAVRKIRQRIWDQIEKSEVPDSADMLLALYGESVFLDELREKSTEWDQLHNEVNALLQAIEEPQ